jgi:5-methylcytosine-specific restriction endonuclease McrA
MCACGCGAEVNAQNGVIDHITPVSSADDPLFWDESNHQPMLRGHHSRKTATQDGGFGHRMGGGVKSI